MPEEKFQMFRNRLTKVYRHLSRQAKRMSVSCYRVYDHDLPEFPYCIEIYGDHLYVAEYKRHHAMSGEDHQKWIDDSLVVMSEVFNIPTERIYIKLRQRKPGRHGQYRKQAEVHNEFIVAENGLKFIVNLSDYLDTGLFLDHRTTRKMVMEDSKDKKILNLFAYTGSFSVFAAAGKAEEVTTVDLSKTYLDWARRNMELNGFTDQGKYSFIQADVLSYLKTITEQYFDLIVLDPPTFSNSQRMEDILDIQRDHVSLINDCLRGMKNGGLLYFSTNYRKFIMDFDSIKSGDIRDITKRTTPFDFESRNTRYCYLIRKDE